MFLQKMDWLVTFSLVAGFVGVFQIRADFVLARELYYSEEAKLSGAYSFETMRGFGSHREHALLAGSPVALPPVRGNYG
jgi:hypothetical protein